MTPATARPKADKRKAPRAKAAPKVKAVPKPKVVAKPAKPKKVPVAIVRLAEALGLRGEAAQCAGLHVQLRKLSRTGAALAATAVLAHTNSGTPVARAYLTTLATPGIVPVPAADVVAKYCAAIARDRKALRGAFVATWARASDMHLVEAAYKNFARELLDDPGLLAAGSEAAQRLASQGICGSRGPARTRAAARKAGDEPREAQRDPRDRRARGRSDR